MASAKVRKGRLAFVVKLLLSGILLAAVALSVDLPAVGQLLTALSPISGAGAVICLVGVTLVSALRWSLVVDAIATPQPLRRMLSLMFVGNFFTQMLPTSVGGDAVRIWQLSQHGVTVERAFAGVLLERISGLLALVFMVAGGVFWLGESLSPPALRYLLFAALPALLAGLLVFCFLNRLPRSWRDLPMLGRGLHLLAMMAGDARQILLAPGRSLVLFLLSAAAHGLAVLAFFSLAHGLGLPLSLPAATAVVPAIILITFLPVSFAGWGVREGASIIMFAAVGLGADQAATLSVLFGVALILAGLPGCLLWLRGAR